MHQWMFIIAANQSKSPTHTWNLMNWDWVPKYSPLLKQRVIVSLLPSRRSEEHTS